jgi:phosphoglycolate phosphatase
VIANPSLAGRDRATRWPVGFDAVLFDLDGTLFDSRPGIEASCRAALERAVPGVEMPDIGPLLSQPLDGLLAQVVAGLSSSQLAIARDVFISHYDTEGWRGSVPYPGVIATLKSLHARRVHLFVATNKRRRPTECILAEAGLARDFDGVFTPDSTDPPWTSKAGMAASCVEQHALDPFQSLVVGDSADDEAMASLNGLSFAAAAWGYGGAASAVPEPGVAKVGYLRKRSKRPIQIVLKSISDLIPLVLPESGVGRRP